MPQILKENLMPLTGSHFYPKLQLKDNESCSLVSVFKQTTLYACVAFEGLLKPFLLPLIALIRLVVFSVFTAYKFIKNAFKKEAGSKEPLAPYLTKIAGSGITLISTLGLYTVAGRLFLSRSFNLMKILTSIGVIIGISITVHVLLAGSTQKND